MNVDSIATIISSLGFPICCCIVLGWYIKNITENYNKQIDDLRKEHKEETLKLTEAINNNTLVIQRLIDKIGDSEK